MGINNIVCCGNCEFSLFPSTAEPCYSCRSYDNHVWKLDEIYDRAMERANAHQIQNDPNVPEPEPIHNSNPVVWELVVADMKKRNEMGTKKYGTPLQPFNGRDPLVDLFQELLDACVYIRQMIYERDNVQEE